MHLLYPTQRILFKSCRKQNSNRAPDPFSHSPILDSGIPASARREWFRDFCVMLILYHVFLEMSN